MLHYKYDQKHLIIQVLHENKCMNKYERVKKNADT
jgi:hypothetical protein